MAASARTPGNYMGVLLEREGRAFVAESFAYHLRWDTGRKRDGGVRVSEVV